MRLAVLCSAGLASAAVPADLITSLPGWEGDFPAKFYSGYLNVSGTKYPKLRIHYQFMESLRLPSKDPVVTWQQGGPGSSSTAIGMIAEMGYFQLSDSAGRTQDGTPRVRSNPHSWNKVANMLYFEHPAGVGFSTCETASGVAEECSWDDKTQAEAYAKTLGAFFAAYPEFKDQDLYLTGESYAGQYIPNIVAYIDSNMSTAFNLKGFAIGNGCWGTDHKCCGDNGDEQDIENYFRHALISKRLYDQIRKACGFPGKAVGTKKCQNLLDKADAAVGPYDVYNIYDNCAPSNWEPSPSALRSRRSAMRRALAPGAEPALGAETSSTCHVGDKVMALWPGDGSFYAAAIVSLNGGTITVRFDDDGSTSTVRGSDVLLDGQPCAAPTPANSTEPEGGYTWHCGGETIAIRWFRLASVRRALHLGEAGASRFSYDGYSHPAIDLYPALVKKYRVLIYSGDADACVPYVGTEGWTSGLADAGVLAEAEAWHPWKASADANIPAGYAVTYTVPGAATDFTFLTIRFAGHEVPAFQPEAALAFITRFLNNETF